MPVYRPTGARRRYPIYIDITISDFSGGLNARDALTELGNNESPDMWNVVIDERGGVAKRLGNSKWNSSALANLVTYGFESHVCAKNLWYTQADGKLYRDTAGTMTLSRTFTAGGRVQIVDFAGVCYLIHSSDGLYSSTDGASWSAVVASTGILPTGDQLAVWQNKLWVADSTSTLLSFSAPGDATKWDSADDAGSNYIREGNDYPIVCLYGTSGADLQAQPALLVGKRSGGQGSMHRVVDAATGDYVTIDQAVGPAGKLAVTNLWGRIYILSTTGVYATDGQNPLEPVGQKLQPLFTQDTIDFSKAASFCAGHKGDELRFSLTRHGSAANDLELRYKPLMQAFTPHSCASAVYLTAGADGDVLLSASPTVTGQVYETDIGGDDDGADITSWFATKVFEFGESYQGRMQHIRSLIRGAFTLSSLKNFEATGVSKAVSITTAGQFQWDVSSMDDPTVGWGVAAAEGYTDFWPRNLGRSFQIRLDETSSLSSLAPDVLGESGGSAGAWALYGMHLSVSSQRPS